MRNQLSKTLFNTMRIDEKIVVLLGDIGVYLFKHIFEEFPTRIYNMGICEQAIISFAAGLSKEGLIPVFYSIAPFVVERAYEQLKIDFGYQKLRGNFINVGASYDYAALGCTHHCPTDVGLLKMIPDMNITIPGCAEEFDTLFQCKYDKGLNYYRLSEYPNNCTYPYGISTATVIKRGTKSTFIAVGSMLELIIDVTQDLDVTVLYYNTVHPFDRETLRSNITGDTIYLCEPYYEGVLDYDIHKALDMPVNIKHIGIPRIFLNKYGNKIEHDEYLGLTKEGILKWL